MRTIADALARFENDHRQAWYGQLGALQFHLSGPQGFQVHAIFEAQGVTLEEGVHPEPNASLTLPAQLFHLFLERAEFLDLRTLLHLRGVEVRGEFALLHQVCCGLARPSSETISQIEESEARSARERCVEIRRIHCDSRADLLAAARGDAPAVLTGALMGWKGLSLQPTRLEDEYGDVLMRSACGLMPMRTFLQKMFEGDTPIYTWGSDLPAGLRPLAPPIDLPTLPPQMWMGSANHRSGSFEPATLLHRDLATSLLCQVFGQKLVVLFSPDQSSYLYPSQNFAFHQPSFADPQKPDDRRFPRLREARPLLTFLMPGEVLVIPRHWYHMVYAMNPTLSLSYLIADDSPFTRALLDVFRRTGAVGFREVLPALHDNIPREHWV